MSHEKKRTGALQGGALPGAAAAAAAAPPGGGGTRRGERGSLPGRVRQRASAGQGVWSKEKLRRLSTWNLEVYDARDSTVSVSVVDFLNLKRADTMP